MNTVDALIERAECGEYGEPCTPERALYITMLEIGFRSRSDQAAHLAFAPARSAGHVPCSVFQALTAAWALCDARDEGVALAQLEQMYEQEAYCCANSGRRSFLPSWGVELNSVSQELARVVRAATK